MPLLVQNPHEGMNGYVGDVIIKKNPSWKQLIVNLCNQTRSGGKHGSRTLARGTFTEFMDFLSSKVLVKC